ncbi:MAG: hypothetical protein ACTSV5_00280 [Promethearchaeota archaeon]
MNARERVLKALNLEEPDRIPLFCQVIMSKFRENLLNIWGDSYEWERKYKLINRDFNLEHKLGFDAA